MIAGCSACRRRSRSDFTSTRTRPQVPRRIVGERSELSSATVVSGASSVGKSLSSSSSSECDHATCSVGTAAAATALRPTFPAGNRQSVGRSPIKRRGCNGTPAQRSNQVSASASFANQASSPPPLRVIGLSPDDFFNAMMTSRQRSSRPANRKASANRNDNNGSRAARACGHSQTSSNRLAAASGSPRSKSRNPNAIVASYPAVVCNASRATSSMTRQFPSASAGSSFARAAFPTSNS